MATPPDSMLSIPIWDTRITMDMFHQLGALTVEEKVQLLSGANFAMTHGVERLGIPPLKLADSTSAIRGGTFHNLMPTCCFPNSTALAATWDKSLIEDMGRSIAGQAKYKAVQVVLGPTVNIHRDPRGGRNFESFSEDPLLTGHIAAALINGIQSQGVGTCVKHFACNESETLRKKYSCEVDERTLREIYLAPFQWLVRESKPTAIMTAYNKINGVYACDTPQINDVLRQEWGFQGLVMSDWFGTNSGPAALAAGLDLEMPGPSRFRGPKLVQDIKNDVISEEILNKRVLEMLRLIARTSDAQSTSEEQVGEDQVANYLARRVASESIVLLKNENNILPIKIQASPKIAVIGAPAVTIASGGGSAGGLPHYLQRPYDFIVKGHPEPSDVRLSAGVPINKIIPMVSTHKIRSNNNEPGMDIVYWNDSADMSEAPVAIEVLPTASMVMMDQLRPGLKKSGFRYKMSATLIPETTGYHTIAVQTTSSFHLFVDGNEVLSSGPPDITMEDFLFVPSKMEYRAKVHMVAGYDYPILLRCHSRPPHDDGEPTPHAAKLCFSEEFSTERAIAEAVEIASTSDVSIVFAGRNAEHESEGFDLDSIKLMEGEVQLIKAVAKASTQTVVVLSGGNPFDVSEWIDDVDALLFSHYAGQEGGQALADVLMGVVSPSGRLPMTWPMCIEDVPSFGNFPAKINEDGSVKLPYEEGLRVGYRHYWQKDGRSTARYDFGHGLSYTSFAFSNLRATLPPASTPLDERFLDITVSVQNTGDVAGAEVVQVYVEDVECSVWRPAKELKAFEKVWLGKGKRATVNFQVSEKYALSWWDEGAKCWRAQEGSFVVWVGGLRTEVMLAEGYVWKGV